MDPKKPFRNIPGGNQPRRRGSKNAVFIALVVLFGLFFYSYSKQSAPVLEDKPLTQVIQDANNGQYDRIVVTGDTLKITKKGEQNPSIQSRKDPQVGLREEGLDTE